MGVGQGTAAGGRDRPGVQLGLQHLNHFLLLLQLPAEPGGEGKAEGEIKVILTSRGQSSWENPPNGS